jgi:Protein of unknown function with HXXEE motif
MSHLQTLLWLCTAAYGAHVIEEFVFDWKNWAQQVLHLPARWDEFYLTNCLVIVVGITCVFIAPEYPAVALGMPGLMVINAIFMHIFPFLRKRGRFSPGLITSVLFFLPLGISTIMAAQPDARMLVIAFAVGAGLLATPISFILLQQNKYFDQTRSY